jgi:hypothetical protein
VASARNEGVYFLDWISYHLALGFEHFFIYSNNNDDGSDELLKYLAINYEFITYIDNPTKENFLHQYKAYNHAFSVLPETLNYEWAAVIDIDEFIVLSAESDYNINYFLQFHNNLGSDAIGLNWKIYYPSKSLSYKDEFVVWRNRIEEKELNRCIKSLIKPRFFDFIHLHFPYIDHNQNVKYNLADGTPHGNYSELPFASETVQHGFAHVNHYIYRSFDEFLWKRSKHCLYVNDLKTDVIEKKEITKFLSQYNQVLLSSEEDPQVKTPFDYSGFIKHREIFSQDEQCMEIHNSIVQKTKLLIQSIKARILENIENNTDAQYVQEVSDFITLCRISQNS